ncbi:MAG: alpha/beta family hydrolase [Candidatus Limnocylindrales bacterium]
MIVYLAHGASGNSDSMRPHIAGLRRRGIEAKAVSLSVGRAEKAVGQYARQVDDIGIQVIGGHSYGGRVASLLAAKTAPAGLVLLSYPLHRPGNPEWETRIPHWASITCPVLLLSGESDPFARIEHLRTAVERLASAELVTYPRIGHGLAPVLDDALDRVARFVSSLSAGAG